MEVLIVYCETYKDHLSIICGQKGQFLGAFANLRKATISFVMSVRPYGSPRLPLDGKFNI